MVIIVEVVVLIDVITNHNHNKAPLSAGDIAVRTAGALAGVLLVRFVVFLFERRKK